jgi:hypothetical protein
MKNPAEKSFLHVVRNLAPALMSCGCASKPVEDRSDVLAQAGIYDQLHPKPHVPQPRMGAGRLGIHYDRDGDGYFEELIRGDFAYFDRNQDGVADLEIASIISSDGNRELRWDADGDGMLDQSILSLEETEHVWKDPRKIHRPGSRIFKDDQILKIIPLQAADSPAFQFWETLLPDSRMKAGNGPEANPGP